MKEKSREQCEKMVTSGQFKKIEKLMETGDQQDREWILEDLGKAAVESDAHYNYLVDLFQEARDKETIIAAAKAMGATGRDAALTQLELVKEHAKDPEIVDALNDARHAIKAAHKT